MARLDTELLVLLSEKAHFAANPDLGPHRLADDEPIPLSIVFTGDLALIEAAGFRVTGLVGQTATGSADINGLKALVDLPSVVRIQGRRKAALRLSSSVPAIKANKVWTQTGNDFIGYTGQGVIVGLIDTGIDFNHHTFKKPDGTTRIRKIWDQTLTALPGETVPQPIANPNIPGSTVHPIQVNYGVEYSQADINPYLDYLTDTAHKPKPAVTVRHLDAHGHGTHAAGIAAGNGSQGGDCFGTFRYVGAAPDADIIMVRKWFSGDPPVTGIHDFLSDAINYIVNEAKQATPLPLVISISLGDFSETQDGTDALSVLTDTLLNSNPGMAIVFAAGNEGGGNFHARATVPASNVVLSLPFNLTTDDKARKTIALTYKGTNLQVQLTSPDGTVIPWLSNTQSGTNTTMNGSGSTVTVKNDPNHLGIMITPPANGSNVPGKWLIELRSPAATTTPFDGFCVGADGGTPTSHRFADGSQCTSLSTLDECAAGKESISVGNYELNLILANSLDSMSSRGPTLETTPRKKPDIAAPGVDIKSAGLASDRCSCCCTCCQSYYVSKSGTSMSTPHIAGVIALMLHKNPNLTHTDIKAKLIAQATPPPSGTSSDDLQGWGAGQPDAQKTVNILVQVNPPKTAPAVAALPETMAALREEFLATGNGPALGRLFDRYFPEILDLVNHNKRVATAWHRIKGPIWTRLAMQAFYNPALRIQREIDGLSLQEAVTRFLASLREYASQAFLKDLQPFEPLLAKIPEELTLSDMIHLVGNFKHPSFTWQQQQAR
jgi:subtilisin family serine protease